MYTFEITGVDEFQTYLYTVRGRYSVMLQAMLDVAKVVQAETLPRTPYKTGRLGESFSWETVEYNREFIEVDVIMSAVDPNSNFQYAEYQHEGDFNHPSPRAGERFYLAKGIRASERMAYEIIKSDYLSLFERVL